MAGIVFLLSKCYNAAIFKEKEVKITFYDRAVKEWQRLEREVCAVQQKLTELPPGKLIGNHYGGRCKWYQSDGQKKSYISQKDRSLAEQLAEKKYLTFLLEDLQQEQQALDFYLRHHRSGTGKAEQLLADSPGYRELLVPHFSPKSQQLSDWMNSPYEHNLKYLEQRTHKTGSGHMVRSKSEAMIAMFLHTNQLPFRYECALTLGEVTLFPDFTVMHPETGKVYYWEHFGRMDDPAYSRNVFAKLQLYTAHGIVPSIQLITTYETKEVPLTSEVIQRVLEQYFL